MYTLAELNEIVENQDLYRNKDDFRFFFLTKSSYILIQNILYFVSNSVKCIICRMTYNITIITIITITITIVCTRWIIEELPLLKRKNKCFLKHYKRTVIASHCTSYYHLCLQCMLGWPKHWRRKNPKFWVGGCHSQPR